jgi:hypothetical protein
MKILNNKPLLFIIGAILLFALPVAFAVYIIVISAMFLMRSLDARLSIKSEDEIAEEMSPVQQTYFYLMKHSTTPLLSDNGEHSELSKYEKETWESIVSGIREEDSK